MKISLNWLKEYINISIPVEEIAENLTDCGLEVEGVEEFTSFPGGLEGLVIGEIVECIPHPNADKLKLTKVDVGKAENLSIVCGAPNVAEGQKVVVAIVNTILYPQNGESFKIKKSKIRGEVSEGMICAEDEIGLGNSHDGIMILPSDTQVGMPASEYFNVVNDKIFEIGLTPNRADATSHYGVARDLAAVLSLKETVELKKPSVEAFKVDEKKSTIQVEVKDFNACPRYSGISLTGVEVKASPDWLQNKLKAIGVKPINNIVDVTNFVLHEIGQPLHAFDADKVAGNKVIVQSLSKNTDFVALDEKQRKLHENDLMICNEKSGMCIAGIFGGAESGVTERTQNIFLESAYFNPVSIRKTAKRHGLNTDASFRYERGADPDITVYALKRAALLMKEVADANVSSEIIDIYPNKIAPFEVDFSFLNCNKLIGQTIAPEIIKKIFEDLEIKILDENEEGIKVAVPPYRVDVQREVDLIEEILRIYGYNQIELPDFMKTSLSFSKKKEPQKIEDTLANFLASNGFYEIFNNSLTNPSYYNEEKEDLVEILNPLSSELEVMRKTLLYGGLEAIQYNKNRKRENLKFFEYGKIYSFSSKRLYKEQRSLGLWITGNNSEENWEEKSEEMDFYTLKTIVHSIFTRLGINFKSESIFNSKFTFGLQYTLGKNILVEFGKLQPKILSKNGIKTKAYYAEFNWDNILKVAPDKDIQYKTVTKFPSIRRDLALLMDQSIEFASIEEIAYKTEKNLLKEVSLFDVYEGSKLPEGKKSYAVSFIFQDDTGTLKDKTVEGIMNKLIQNYKVRLKIELR